MQQSIEENLLKAIKKDDLKAFYALIEMPGYETYRLGRFPLLSLMYLYKSRKLLSVYEKKLMQVTSYEVLREPVELSKKFSAKAGKCLRLYLNNEIVSPFEMLLILDKTTHLKRIYPTIRTSSAIRGRLKAIYFIKYSLSVKFEGDNIVIDRRPLSYREKKNIFTVCLSVILAVTVVVGVPVATVTLIPKPIEGLITQFEEIDFNASKQYVFNQDIIIPDNYSVEKVKCSFNGNGNKLILGSGVKLGELSGRISNMIIEYSDNPLFTVVLENAAIENVTVNVNADVATAEGTSFVAVTNYGTIENVTVNLSGQINATAPPTESEEAQELAFGGIVQNNHYGYSSTSQNVYRGVIKNCTVNFSQFKLAGEASANASFGGVAGINNGYLQNCTVTGEITADTFDLAGICSSNNGVLSGNVNEASLSQTSSDTDWNPIVCGIVLTNTYAVTNCENRGNISSVSNCGQFEIQEGFEATASAAGIAYLNRGSSSNVYLKNCINYGKIECSAEYRSVYVSGVCLSSNGGIDSCKNIGDITAKSANGCETNVGGVATVAYGNVIKSVNEGAISATGSGVAHVGGISARLCAQILNCISSGNISVTAKKVYTGGIYGIGEIQSNGYYVYYSTANYCISEGDIDVKVIDGAPAYVGGIAGYVLEEGFTSGDTVAYFGGCVNNSFFTGKCITDVTYFGSIAGVCGANIYASNSFVSGTAISHNFDNNYYLSGSKPAFGATVTPDGVFASAEDKGASASTIEDMKNSEAYKSILSALEE